MKTHKLQRNIIVIFSCILITSIFSALYFPPIFSKESHDELGVTKVNKVSETENGQRISKIITDSTEDFDRVRNTLNFKTQYLSEKYKATVLAQANVSAIEVSNEPLILKIQASADGTIEDVQIIQYNRNVEINKGILSIVKNIAKIELDPYVDNSLKTNFTVYF